MGCPFSFESVYFWWLKFNSGLALNTVFHSTYNTVFLYALADKNILSFPCIPASASFISLCLSHCFSASAFLLFLSLLLYYFLNVAVTQWQQPPTSSKGAFFLLCFFARLLLLYGVALCLPLQCCFTGPAGVARVRQPGPVTRWFHDSGAPCLANLPAAGVWGPAWLILSLPWLFGFILGCGCSQAWMGQPDIYWGVCTDIYLDGDTGDARLKGKGNVEWGRRDSGRMKCQATGRLSGWIVGKRSSMHAETQRHAYANTHTHTEKKLRSRHAGWLAGSLANVMCRQTH